MKSSIRNEIKAQIIRAGYTMQEVVDQLHDEYGWSDSVSNLSGKLQREPLLIGDKTKEVSRVAWCSGGAQGMFEEAIAQGVDVFLSGEISEQTVHLARETGVAYIAAGHHVTERPGVRALAAHLAERFGLACEFVEIDNPV